MTDTRQNALDNLAAIRRVAYDRAFCVKIGCVYEALDWTWANFDVPRVPVARDIEVCLFGLIAECGEKLATGYESWTASTGGLQVSVSPNHADIQFAYKVDCKI